MIVPHLQPSGGQVVQRSRAMPTDANYDSIVHVLLSAISAHLLTSVKNVVLRRTGWSPKSSCRPVTVRYLLRQLLVQPDFA